MSDDAPVNAPFTWPKSSDSSRFSGRAAQLTATNAFFFRTLLAWIAFAITSLPDPLGPPMSTVWSVGATRRTISHSFRMCGLSAMMFSKP